MIEQVLRNVNCASIVTIVAQTVPSNLKKEFKGKITKISKVNGIICFMYENAVNNQRIREEKVPDFEAEPRKWGNRIQGTPLVEHNDELYLEIKVQNSTSVYLDENGAEVKESDVTTQKKSAKNQGVEKPVILRDYKLENIIELHMKGFTLSKNNQ